MGNCIRKESARQWAGEDWGSLASSPETRFSGDTGHQRAEEGRLLEDDTYKAGPPSTEVKIKITKKELEELLGRMEVQGMSVHQLLEQLMMSGGDRFEAHRTAWRPALQSIPEVN